MPLYHVEMVEEPRPLWNLCECECPEHQPTHFHGVWGIISSDGILVVRFCTEQAAQKHLADMLEGLDNPT